jgi:hypothetical protein
MRPQAGVVIRELRRTMWQAGVALREVGRVSRSAREAASSTKVVRARVRVRVRARVS